MTTMPKKSSIQQKTGGLFNIAVTTILLFLLVDVILGAWVISLVQEQGQDKIIDDYFFAGDVHFTEQGNEVTARTLLDIGVK